MVVRDIKQSKSQIVNMDVAAVKSKGLRLEVTTALGIHMASFVMKENEVRCLLPQEKRFLSGPASKESMKAFLGVDLDPHLLMNILFDDEPKGEGWVCKRDKSNFLENCENSKSAVKVGWRDREVGRRRVTINNKNFDIQIALQGFSTKVENESGLFELNAPDGYTKEKLTK